MICHIDFEPEEENITYCKSCGQNLHNDCIDDWTKKKPKCPFCNARWISHTKPQSADSWTLMPSTSTLADYTSASFQLSRLTRMTWMSASLTS